MNARRPALALALMGALVLGFAGPAAAHRLKLFATVVDGAIDGYAFFIGGGRPEGVEVVFNDTTGRAVHRLTSDDKGAFHWRPETSGDLVVTVDTGDGHRASETIAGERLAATAPATTSAPPLPASAPAPVAASTPPPPACAAPDPAAAAALIEAAVDRAVARQLRPLIEAQTLAEGRVRFNDVMGGVGMIVGLAGAGLWAMARRRRDDGRPT